MHRYNGFQPAQRVRALKYVNAEIAAGRLAPPAACQLCDSRGGVVDYHAEDYSEPFGPHVHRYALCYFCHMMIHYRRHDLAFNRFTELLSMGAVFRPLRFRHLELIRGFVAGSVMPDYEIRAARPRLSVLQTLLAEGLEVRKRNGVLSSWE